MTWARWMRHNPSPRREDPDYLWLALVKMEHHRAIYRRIGEITTAAELPSSSFFGYLTTTYVDSQTVAIRRASGTDRRRQSITIRRLLEEIGEEIDRLDAPRGYAFDDRWDSAIAVGQVEAEIAQLDRDVEPVNDVVDQRFAHMDEREVAPLTFDAIKPGDRYARQRLPKSRGIPDRWNDSGSCTGHPGGLGSGLPADLAPRAALICSIPSRKREPAVASILPKIKSDCSDGVNARDNARCVDLMPTWALLLPGCCHAIRRGRRPTAVYPLRDLELK